MRVKSAGRARGSLHAAHLCARRPAYRPAPGGATAMAEHTSSSITIEAAPADVMEVIADFARYPDWTGEVKEADVLRTDERGRAEQVRLVMDAGAIKDDQVLAYTWTGDNEVSWTLVKSQMLRSLDGSYLLKATAAGSTEV